jgi:hypothetical protein
MGWRAAGGFRKRGEFGIALVPQSVIPAYAGIQLERAPEGSGGCTALIHPTFLLPSCQSLIALERVTPPVMIG